MHYPEVTIILLANISLLKTSLKLYLDARKSVKWRPQLDSCLSATSLYNGKAYHNHLWPIITISTTPGVKVLSSFPVWLCSLKLSHNLCSVNHSFLNTRTVLAIPLVQHLDLPFVNYFCVLPTRSRPLGGFWPSWVLFGTEWSLSANFIVIETYSAHQLLLLGTPFVYTPQFPGI